MFRHHFAFELRYFLRGWMVWIFLVIIGVLLFGAISSDRVMVGGGIGATHRNAPWVIQNYYAVMAILTLLMTTAFVNNSGIRDFQYNTHQMLFSLPVKKLDFLLGRYAGATLAAMIPSLGVSLGALFARFAPWADSERFGPIYAMAHVNSVVAFVIPNTIFIAAILFGVAVLFRSTTVSFLAGLGLLVLFGVTDWLADDLKNETLAAMLDPFGTRAFTLVTKYWTVAEKNTQSVGLGGLLLWNRLAWMAAGLGVFALIASRVTLTERASKKRKAEEEDSGGTPAVFVTAKPSWTGSAAATQWWASFRFEFRALVKTPTFIVILAAALLNCVTSLSLSTPEGYGNKTFPVTYWTTQIIQGTLYAFLIAILTFFAGQLVWRERDERMDEIQDSLPAPDWLLYAAKLSALLAAVFLLLLAGVASGVMVQAGRGYTRFQLDLYVQQLLVRDFSLMAYLSVAAFLCHVLSPNKYVGYFSFITLMIVNAFVWDAIDVASRMPRFGSRPVFPYSDFYGFAPAAHAWWWFSVYWGLCCVLLAVATIALYRRGKETAWRHRLQVAGQRFRGGLRVAGLVSAAAFAAVAGWIYYNTSVLNELVSPEENRRRAADYERQYKKYEKLAQPRVLDVRYEIDLYPEKRGVAMRGVETVTNASAGPVAEVHFNVNHDYAVEIRMDGATLASDDRRLGYRIYRLAAPMQPDERRTVAFTVSGEESGFANSVERRELLPNGSFFNNTIAPQIGYQAGRELSDRNERRKQKLPEKDPMPALERDCRAHCMNTYISNNSDWVNVETVISTPADQTAVAPGSLVKEWQANGRNYYQYRLDKQALNFYSFISARYQVAREEWNGIRLEVYYHPEHTWNVARMMQSMKQSLGYYTAAFGPYYQKQARIIEFPRVARFAQAFPGTMPYSEGIGFVADLRNPEDIDHVFYVVAHEMAHQWWAHQVIGANMQGATILSETLAQYSALMVMEKEYGRDMMRKFLEYEADNYLRSRGTERLKERPLERVESGQGYIHYRKGSVAMYYLKEMIGEEAVNRALRRLVEKFAYAAPPYPTSYELVDRLREQTPEQYRYLIKDLFEEITLFSNRTLESTARRLPDGKYEVTVRAEAKKYRADEGGSEKETKVADWIEVGAFAKPAKGKKYGKTLYRERLWVESPAVTRTFVVEEAPYQAGIDPFHLMIDRTPDDNTKRVTMQ